MTEPKVTEPSEWIAQRAEALRLKLEVTTDWVLCLGYIAANLDAAYRAGRASRDAEVAGLRARVLECETLDSHLVDALAEVEALKAERDKLHAALAWMVDYVGVGKALSQLVDSEPHDCSPAGRAAALVRLFERCTDGK